jgi:predicted NUDIX family NTP pyrophosphohydrolase
MPKKSAGILLYRIKNQVLEVLLMHPGGPFWTNKDAGAWSIPKGEIEENEASWDAAKREFEEETSVKISGEGIELMPVRQKSNKLVLAWAVRQDLDPASIKSNFFEIEWPPKSGKMKSFPEMDKAGWFNLPEAKQKILEAQIPLIEELEARLPNEFK